MGRGPGGGLRPSSVNVCDSVSWTWARIRCTSWWSNAYRGARPTPVYSHKAELRLGDHLEGGTLLSEEGAQQLRAFVREALQIAEDKGVEELLAFATSAVREAANADEVLAKIREESDTHIQVLSGQDEARLTFLAARRWFGWSSGKLLDPGHRRRITGDRRGSGRGTRRGHLAAARREPADPGLAHQRPALARSGAPAAPARAGRDRAAGPGHAGRQARPGRGHLQDVPAAGPDRGRGTVQRWSLRAAAAQPQRPDQAGRQAVRHVGGRPGADARGVPRPGRSSPRGPSWPTRPWTCSTWKSSFICPWALREGVILRRLDALTTGMPGR